MRISNSNIKLKCHVFGIKRFISSVVLGSSPVVAHMMVIEGLHGC